MKDKIIQLAKANGADIVRFAPAQRFENDNPIFKIMPETKTVIGFGFRVLRGIYRGIEEGSTYYQYTTMAVENMEETIMPMAQLRVAMLLEEEGYIALPQRRHQQIMAQDDDTNPEVAYDAVYRSKTAENQMDFLDTAVKCGLGERGLHNTLLTDQFGPFVRYCFVLTDAELEADDMIQPHLCDKCGKCVKACPGNAINENGDVDSWQCAVYYNGANGTKNPFMPPDAFANFDNRIEIIAGEAKVTPDTAKKILDNIYFYPPAQHAYQCSICGRACDMACYMHLEEKGVLTKQFRTPFRKREEWRFDIKSFK
ncbi:MAG: epoxyqueuosine reductase [Clostridia bacterium]|nr:epoxyqueuosine reductase [Clostridia bacterium]